MNDRPMPGSSAGLVERKGGGCFLVGSGPGLNAVDVTRLARLDTMAFNRSYIAWMQWGFAPTLYACLDHLAFEDNVPEIKRLIEEFPRTRFFLPDRAASFGIRSSAQVSLIGMAPGHKFSSDILALTDFGNVGATSLQILALLGYRRITMIGVDARYRRAEQAPVVAEEEGYVLLEDDTDHFSAEYGRGRRSRANPDLGRILGQWPEVASECARIGIEVRNASRGSALECFPRTDFASAIDWVLGR